MVGAYGIRILCACAAVFLATPAAAQVSIETQQDFGLLRVTVAPEKTTFIGSYGEYAEPAISRAWDVFWHGPPRASGGSSSGGGSSSSGGSGSGAARPARKPRPDMWHIILPSGKLPHDLRLRYTGVPGWTASVMYEPDIIKLWAGLSPRVTVAAVSDMNALTGYAPSGFGILIDPTRGYASAEFAAVGGELSLPVWGFTNGTGEYALYAGHGWMKEWSFSYGTAKSVFLQLSNPTYFHSTIQTYSLTAEYRRPPGGPSFLDVPKVARFEGVGFSLVGYGTEHMWTVGATASLIWRL
jgi:hypothetical protein